MTHEQSPPRHAIGRPRLRSQRLCLLEGQIARIKPRARQRRTLLDDRLTDVDAVSGDAIADLAAMRPLAGQAAGQLAIADDVDHRSPRDLAALAIEFAGIDAFEPDVNASNHHGVAVKHVSGARDQQRGGKEEERFTVDPSVACRSAIRLALARLLTLFQSARAGGTPCTRQANRGGRGRWCSRVAG